MNEEVNEKQRERERRVGGREVEAESRDRASDRDRGN